LEKLQSLSQIGEHKANLILENRPYNKMSDIMKVHGVGEETYHKVNKYFKVSKVGDIK
jgi:DNA uptake protein ComE-like DNA-binding protein